jgi:formylglycine-generating enzyme required for sulfatase activity/DNA-binding NarL/FixJ family response regulator
MRILIVDDEAGVLQALMAIVKAMPGHDVRVAASAQKAHEHATALGGADLLITDVVMEPTDGFTLRAEMQELHPALQAIFISGYDLSEYVEQTAGTPVLAKPVDADALRKEIENAAARLAAPAPVAVPVAVAASQPVAAAVQPVAVAQPTVRAVPQGMPASAVAQPTVRAVPQATPVAVPSAAPVPAAVPSAPTAQPTARAVPQATPVAVPSAARVPVAVPSAPAAQPIARAVPQATPVAVPSAAPVPPAVPPAPAAQPTARAVPQATPVAVPSAAPVPAAVPPAPTARAVPQATPVAAPPPTPVAVKPPPIPPAPATVRVAAPAASAVPAVQTPAAVPAAAPSGPPDPLIGVQLGDYRVQQLIGEGKWGRVYLALQLSVNRRVGLKILNPAHSEDDGARAQFLADARAKAAVQHPFIMTVFEADDRNGLAFYTEEFLDGATAEERIARGQKLDEKTALHLMKVAGEGLQYLWSHNLSHAPIGAESLRLGNDNIARLSNIATADANPAVTVEQELHTVGTIIQKLTQEELISGGLRALLTRMTGGPNPVTGWPLVLQAVKALEPKVIPVEAAKMKAADAAAMRAVEAARKAKKRAVFISVATLCVLVLVLGFVVWHFLLSGARKLDVQVEIPAGSYTVGEGGTKAMLGAFEIDKYEVSIGEYRKFIVWCEKNEDREHEFDHPRGERRLSHVNDDAKTLIMNASVRGRRVFKQATDPGVEIDLNSPMVGVTFWDAYAYAHWRGKIVEGGAPRDLPTEEEWEAAARGTKGFKYPWGDEQKLKNFNSNQGYKALEPGGTKTDDGYNYWAPVDAFGSDISEFKVVGMAGNVAEWVYRKEGAKEHALLKGGSFASDPVTMWDRILKIPVDDAWFVWPAAQKPKGMAGVLPPGVTRFYVGDDVIPSFRSLYVGFRTVKRK